MRPSDRALHILMGVIYFKIVSSWLSETGGKSLDCSVISLMCFSWLHSNEPLPVNIWSSRLTLRYNGDFPDKIMTLSVILMQSRFINIDKSCQDGNDFPPTWFRFSKGNWIFLHCYDPVRDWKVTQLPPENFKVKI